MARKMTLTEAAEYLRRPPKTIYNWTSRKEIPHLKVRGRLLFNEEDLDAWLEQFQVEGDPRGESARTGTKGP